MQRGARLIACLLLCLLAVQGPSPWPLVAATRDEAPWLRLEAGGPTSFVSGLAASPDGKALYAAGWDKVVYVWLVNPQTGRLNLDRAATYRVPIGPGLDGAINSVAVSPDGSLLAAGGQGVVRGGSDLRHPGWVVPEAGGMSDTMRQDQGTIYLFNTRTREVRPLRGHRGPVLALAFATQQAGKPAMLISAAKEWDSRRGQFTAAVRLWDAQQARYMAGVTLPLTATRPGLAAWHTGNQPKQLRVAIAWGDSSQVFRVWDVEANELKSAADGQYNNTAAFWPTRSRVITGSTGRLKLWNASAGRGRPPVVERELRLPDQAVPRAVALCSSSGQGALDMAAVVMRFPAADQEDRLWLVDLQSFRPLDVDVRLWNGRGTMPTLSAAPGGRHLAVAGGVTRQLTVFNIDDLRGGRAGAQSLEGTGVTPRSAVFVRKAESLGVLLSELARPAPGAPFLAGAGDMLFDPLKRHVTTNHEGWNVAAPRLDGWQLEHAAARDGDGPNRAYVHVRGGGVDRRIWLSPNQRLTDYALLPPRESVAVPILAVAAHELGQPRLYLYNAATGEMVRQLVGHVERIGSLAFSDEGPLLVSAAEDRTVCVWNLADLHQVLGMRGTLPGLVVKQQGDRLVVADIEELLAPATGQLAVDDEVLGLVENGDLRQVAGPLDFYLTLSRFKPGQTIVVRRARGGQAPQDAPIRLGQGVDERKPLFSLFIAQGDGSREWNWIGWSPLGPYESSGEQIDRWLGWHFNTGLPEAPARFALAGQYPDLHREGLIAKLLQSPELPEPDDAPLRAPDMSLWLEEAGQPPATPDEKGLVRLGTTQAVLHATVDGLSPDLIDSVTWQVADGEPQPMQAATRQQWSAVLDNVPWQRRDYPVRVTLRTREAEPQDFTGKLLLRYQPLPPELEIVEPQAERSVVENARYHFQFKAQASRALAGDRRLVVNLVHRADGKLVAEREWAPDDRLEISEPLTLEPGSNSILLTARNDSAPADAAAAETSTLVRLITYNPKPVAPPALKLHVVVPESGIKQELASDQGPALVVDLPRIRIQGVIEAEEPLEQAEWLRGDGDRSQKLGEFVPGQQARLTVDEAVSLEPGPQRIRLRAKTAGSVAVEASIVVDYCPRLPAVVLTSPAANLVLVDGRDEPQIELSGRLEPPEDEHPYEVQVVLNGQALPDAPKIDREEHAFRATIALQPGENLLQLRLSNPWRESMTKAVAVYYKRPPRIVSIDAPPFTEQSLLDLAFVVESPTELELNGLHVNGWELPLQAAVVEQRGPLVTRWRVEAKDIPLKEGDNTVRPAARNRDGWSAGTQERSVTVMLPPPPQAEIVFLDPAADATVETSRRRVSFVVTSQSRLKRVALLHGRRPLVNADVSQQTQNSQGEFVIEAAPLVELAPQINRLTVVAVNDGGESRTAVALTYVPRPVRLLIDGVQSQDSPDTVLKPRVEEGGRLVFEKPAAVGTVRLLGRIQWLARDEQQRHQVSMVHVRVNGFLQPPVVLEPAAAGGLEWPWRARLRLNRDRNVVHIELEGPEQDAGNRSEFEIACTEPDQRQRLHLLVVGIGQDNAAELEERALRAVQGRRLAGDRITAAAFSQGWIYGPLTGEVSRSMLLDRLLRIRVVIAEAAATDAGNDVVMVYFRGKEAVGDDGEFYLLTSESLYSADLKSAAISGERLTSMFNPSPGAQVFLLDVERRPLGDGGPDPAELQARWPPDAQLGALRYAWLEGSDPPRQARLLVAFEQAAPKAGNLAEIDREISASYRQAREQFGAVLQYEPYIPPSLAGLVLGAR